MNQVARTNRLTHFRQALLAGSLLLLLLLTACFGGGDNATQETAATEQAATSATGNLTCSTSCINQGQCGTTIDGRTVILANSAQPATRDHDVLMDNNSFVNILAQETHTVQDATGTPFSLNFFEVQPAEGGPAGWVTGSCVNPTTQQ